MQIGKINIPQAILLAPMEEVTDISFRLICKRLGADMVFTEFINSDGLVRNSLKTKQKMTFLPEEHPIGIQIYGGDENAMEGAARLAEELQPDLIDINCGCWVRKVVGRGAGAGLLRDLDKMKQIILAVVKSVKTPVTVKTRLGWDEKSIEIVDVAKMIEDTGAQALTIHCRTRAQGQKGTPDFQYIPEIKKAVRIPIIANGGIDTPEIAKTVFDSTGCDGIMLARGAIYNPWLFHEIKHYIATGVLLPKPSLIDRIQLLIEHLRLSVLYKGERKGIIEFRKHYSGYLHSYPGINKLRIEMMQYTEQQPVIDHLNNFIKTFDENLIIDHEEILIP
jgi:tRNA-dihydrouridine synthase B